VKLLLIVQPFVTNVMMEFVVVGVNLVKNALQLVYAKILVMYLVVRNVVMMGVITGVIIQYVIFVRLENVIWIRLALNLVMGAEMKLVLICVKKTKRVSMEFVEIVLILVLKWIQKVIANLVVHLVKFVAMMKHVIAVVNVLLLLVILVLHPILIVIKIIVIVVRFLLMILLEVDAYQLVLTLVKNVKIKNVLTVVLLIVNIVRMVIA